jgi:hypothetical protein
LGQAGSLIGDDQPKIPPPKEATIAQIKLKILI